MKYRKHTIKEVLNVIAIHSVIPKKLYLLRVNGNTYPQLNSSYFN